MSLFVHVYVVVKLAITFLPKDLMRYINCGNPSFKMENILYIGLKKMGKKISRSYIYLKRSDKN